MTFFFSHQAFEKLQLDEIGEKLKAAQQLLDQLAGIFDGILGPLLPVFQGIADIFSFIKWVVVETTAASEGGSLMCTWTFCHGSQAGCCRTWWAVRVLCV